MATVLQGWKGILYYLDDVLLTGANMYERTHTKFKEYYFQASEIWIKTEWSYNLIFQSTVELLGHVVTSNGISPYWTKGKLHFASANAYDSKWTLNCFWI